jgi:uncharacterized membrane protein
VKPTRGCGSSGTEGEGPQGLLGLLISIAFVFGFVSIFLPMVGDWFFPSFIAVEFVATVLYLLAARRSRNDSARMWRELHQINEKTLR